MRIEVSAVITSDTMGEATIDVFANQRKVFADNNYDFNFAPRMAGTRRLGDINAPELVEMYIRGQYDDMNRVIRDYLPQFYNNNHVQVRFTGVQPQNIIESGLRITRRGRVQDPRRAVSFVKTETIIKRYNLFGTVKLIPYTNYDNNISDFPCVYNYVRNNYTKSVKKYLDKFNTDKGVCLEDIMHFTNSKKIPCKLYDISGRCFYQNNLPHNKNYKNFYAIIANNHLYPVKSNVNNPYPLLPTNKTEEQYDSIKIMAGSKIYTAVGVENTYDGEFLYDEFFRKLNKNWNYNSDVVLFKSLTYTSKSVGNIVMERDLRKAYFNVANNCKIEYYPVFGVEDFWKKYKGSDIDVLNYYAMTKNAMEKLKKYGFTSNLCSGYMAELLIQHKLLKTSDLEYVKKPSCMAKWSDVLTRIKSLHKEHGLEDTFIYYNGVLGKTKTTSSIKISNLCVEDYDILNYGLEEPIWFQVPSTEGVAFEKELPMSFRYINHTNVYNVIVEQTNIEILKKVLEVKDKFNVMPDKIKVDAIGYGNVDCIDDIHKIFDESELEYKNETQYNTNYIEFEQSFTDITEVYFNVLDELNKMADNITFNGSAGTGKTTLVKEQCDYDFAMAFTNLCAGNIKGKTMYSSFMMWEPSMWYKALSKYRNKTIWIDEYSMIGREYWLFIAIGAIQYNVKFIFSGDPKQIPPINEKPYNYDSKFFKKLFGKQTTLTKDYRNDQKIIELRDFVAENFDNPVKLYQRFMNCNDLNYIHKDHHITYTHKTRIAINNQIMKHRKFVFDPKKGIVSVGVILSGRINNSKLGIVKNVRYKVIATTDDSVIFDTGLIVSKSSLIYFRLGFAITSHSAQGLTIAEPMAIHDIKKMIYSEPRILYTAITRAKEFDKISLIYFEKHLNQAEPLAFLDIDDEFEEKDKIYQV